ncbi:unnamed protein product [Rotaria sp. Silwood2]|nr:unnamed protein product [Rotaria sp. Silwood2]
MKSSTHDNKFHFDAIVIGAGFGGLYSLYKLRYDLGLNVRGFEKGSGVGGTWYWNRYPGALSNSESFVYCYSFDKELLQDWDFDTRYVMQPQILTYLEHVADRFDLRRDIQFNTSVTAAYYNELRNVWEIHTDNGGQFTASFLFTALGVLSAVNYPNIKGRETFKGKCYHTGEWPEHVTFDNKRVGVIGTGSTEPRSISKWIAGFGDPSRDFNAFHNNNKDENSNPDSGSGRIGRAGFNGDHVGFGSDNFRNSRVEKAENFGKYHQTQVRYIPEVKPIEFYEQANLDTQVLSNIRRVHFEEPTPVQRYTIPCIREEDDIIACAQTGFGKTFCCWCGHDMFDIYHRLREGVHILLAPTGRLKDMLEKYRISLTKVKYFVLDQTDQSEKTSLI